MPRIVCLGILLLALSGIAAAAEPAPAVPPAPVVVPMLSVLPQQGIVTIVASYGQFYTNLGAKERLCPGAALLVLRDGAVIARARVLKVNMLDSIAELLPAFGAVVPQAGDKLLVEFNPKTPTVKLRHPPMMVGEVGTTCTPPALPAIEPDMSFHDLEPFYALAILAGVVIAVVD